MGINIISLTVTQENGVPLSAPETRGFLLSGIVSPITDTGIGRKFLYQNSPNYIITMLVSESLFDIESASTEAALLTVVGEGVNPPLTQPVVAYGAVFFAQHLTQQIITDTTGITTSGTSFYYKQGATEVMYVVSSGIDEVVESFSGGSFGEEINYPITMQGITAQSTNYRLKCYAVGNLVSLTVNPDTTVSNSNLFGFPLPFPAARGTKSSFPMTAQNSGSILTNGGRCEIQDNSNHVPMRISDAAAITSWGTTGNKTNFASITYIANRKNKRKVFIDGDSRSVNDESAGVSRANGWRLYSTLQQNLVNLGDMPCIYPVGTPGRTVQNLILDFPTKIGQYLEDGDIVIFFGGVNDVRAGANVATVTNRIIQYHTQARNWNGKRITTIDITGVPGQLSGDPANTSADMLACAANLIANPSYCDYQVNLSLNSNFNEPTDRTNLTNYTTDELHFTNLTYDTYLEPALRAILQPIIF